MVKPTWAIQQERDHLLVVLPRTRTILGRIHLVNGEDGVTRYEATGSAFLYSQVALSVEDLWRLQFHKKETGNA